jgi:predicted Zn-dependent protease
VGRTDVGRKEVVLDGYTHAAVIGNVVLPALSLGRALGEEQDSSGTTILAPPESILGHPLASPLVSLRVTPDVPQYGAAQWDDEGVATTAAPLITNGTVVDYLGTRLTRQALPSSVSRATAPGTATAADVQRVPTGIPISTAMAAAPSGPSLAALAKDIQNGFLIRGIQEVLTDQQCAGGTIIPDVMLEVRRGQILRRVMDAHLAFTTKKFWHGLTVLGDASTLCTASCDDLAGPPPWKPFTRIVTAPAAHFKEVDIVASNVNY